MFFFLVSQRYKKSNSNRGGGAVDVEGVDASDPLLLSFYGTAAAYNKSLRKELLNVRIKRDRFLEARMRILKPFLIEKVPQFSSLHQRRPRLICLTFYVLFPFMRSELFLPKR